MEFRRAILIGFLGLTVGGVAAAGVKSNEPARATPPAPTLESLADEVQEGLFDLETQLQRLDAASEDERDAIERELESGISKLQRSLDAARKDLG